MFPANLHKKALCVGISYKGQRGPYGLPPKDWELEGAHNDVRKVIGLLTKYYGYEEDNITVLLDAADHTPPTEKNIVSAMEALLDGASPGENLFFFFAGHGDQITNLDHTEDDGKDEIILPLDWKLDETLDKEDRKRYSQIIIDDDMNNILVKRLPRGCRLTALFDSCHSGTILDLPYSRFYGPRSPQRSDSPAPGSPITLPRPPSQSHPQSPTDVLPHNQVRRGPLELTYAINARGRKDPLWRKGPCILRGATLDDRISGTPASEAAEAISWSACSDGQNGYEMRRSCKSTHENISGGVMVDAFVAILENDPYRPYGDILECLTERVREACGKINKGKPEDEWIMQEPQLGSQKKPDLGQLFAP
ncbi:peptidase C14, caspase domain-containing protein [Gautieria morchelliformis]|nr:peptidase C14, caspase domain-containing protein [Gautieria morchelliformis]